MLSHLKFKRILIKLSGESLSINGFGIQVEAIKWIIHDIHKVQKMGVEIAIVIGAGNIIRGGKAEFGNQIDRSTADTMGMLATMINALALSDILSKNGVNNELVSSRGIDGIIQTSCIKIVKNYLSSGKVVVFAGGTGNPFVTTDSTASLRAAEIQADAILKVTTVDGVYDKDPKEHNNAKKFDVISYSYALRKELGVMDFGAFIQARDFNIPICIFNFKKPGALMRVLNNEPEGTWIVKN